MEVETIMPFEREVYNSPKDYEHKLADKIEGAKPQIASGAFSGDYDVVKRGDYGMMADCKRTDAKSFSVNFEKFKAIEERSSLDQVPAITVNFNKYERSLAIIRQEDLIGLLNMASAYDRLTRE